MAPLVWLVGSGGHASVVADAIERQGAYKLAGFIDSFRPAGEGPLGYPIIGAQDEKDDLTSILRRVEPQALVVAIGDNWKRAQIVELAKLNGPVTFPAIVHPSAQVARTAFIGEGSVLLAGAVVNSGASIGRWCIVNTNSSFDHDSKLGDFSSLAPGVTVGGNAVIGGYSAVSLGADVIHRITIGEHSVIGAGAVVVKDIPACVVAYGNPAKVHRSRQIGESYL